MDIPLTIAALLVLIAAGAYVIHRLNSAHSERIALRSYSRFLPGPPAAAERAAGTTAPLASHSTPSAGHERRDHRDGGRGHFRPRHHRERTTNNQRNTAGR
ncbi:hypothetical protein ACGFS9_10625 [Streptomyces sp. NPDC048566]|uniref:hypothetical protein n=1 Tax=Streptomyces sp. NPDC048566 TaxID=3365569 RepID=UPI0037182003